MRWFLSKDERQALFLESLEKQKHPLTSNQFKKLTKCKLPPEKTYQEFMFEWAAKSKQKKDAQDKFVADAIKLLAEACKAHEIQQRYKESKSEFESKNNNHIIHTQNPRLQPIRYLKLFAVCLLCVAVGVVSLFGGGLFGRGIGAGGKGSAGLGGGDKTYLAATPVVYSNLNEFYSDLNSEGIHFFNMIVDEMAFASYETDVNDSTLILGYKIQGLGVMASDGSLFCPVEFRVTTCDYEFADYEMYQNLASTFNSVVTINFEINEINNDAYINFSYEKFSYYIYAKGFCVEGVCTVVTPANIQTLIEDLIFNI